MGSSSCPSHYSVFSFLLNGEDKKSHVNILIALKIYLCHTILSWKYICYNSFYCYINLLIPKNNFFNFNNVEQVLPKYDCNQDDNVLLNLLVPFAEDDDCS